MNEQQQAPTMEGWVEKESRHLGAWRSRYLILRLDVLCTYGEAELLSPTKPKPSECIPLLGWVCAATQSRGRRQHTFVVRSSGREVHFACTSALHAEDWVTAICKQITASVTRLAYASLQSPIRSPSSLIQRVGLVGSGGRDESWGGVEPLEEELTPGEERLLAAVMMGYLRLMLGQTREAFGVWRDSAAKERAKLESARPERVTAEARGAANAVANAVAASAVVAAANAQGLAAAARRDKAKAEEAEAEAEDVAAVAREEARVARAEVETARAEASAAVTQVVEARAAAMLAVARAAAASKASAAAEAEAAAARDAEKEAAVLREVGAVAAERAGLLEGAVSACHLASSSLGMYTACTPHVHVHVDVRSLHTPDSRRQPTLCTPHFLA